jgi:lysophospholipase L1-like esterase
MRSIRFPGRALAGLVALALPALAAAPAGRAQDAPLTITTTLSRPGYVGVTIAGPPGAGVQLGEELPSGTTTPLQFITLDPSGAATQIPEALSWRCDRTQRTLVASTLPPAAPQEQTVTVTTPSCAKRLAARFRRAATVGATASIVLVDRWRVGGLPLAICVAPPGAGARCRRWQLHPGQSRRVVRIPVPRPGGWRLTVSTTYGYRRRALVWVSHPGGRLRLLAVGDSEMQILDGDIAQDLAADGVQVTSDARISTGLTKPFMFNWEAHAGQQAASVRPDMTVMFIGANDGFSVAGPGGQQVGCCGAAWSAGYANLVAEMMRSYLRGNAGRVYWFVLPAPRPGNFQSLFDAVNAGIRAAAGRFPGRVALIDANAFFTPHNQYRDYMSYRGRGFTIHESDGIHLSAAADQVAAALLVRQLRADRLIR